MTQSANQVTERHSSSTRLLIDLMKRHFPKNVRGSLRHFLRHLHLEMHNKELELGRISVVIISK